MATIMRRLGPSDRLVELIKTDFKLKYQKSTLGILWSLLKPLLMIATLYLVFTVGGVGNFSESISDYTLFLIIGVVVWNYFSNSLIRSYNAYLEHKNILKSIHFPRQELIKSIVTTEGLTLIIYLSILLLMASAMGSLSFAAFLVAVPIVALVILSYSLSLALAPLHARFGDVGHIVEIMLHAGFFITPIFYSPAMVPHPFLTVYMLNPVARIITETRQLLLAGTVPEPLSVLLTFVIIGIVFIICKMVFMKFDPKVVESL